MRRGVRGLSALALFLALLLAALALYDRAAPAPAPWLTRLGLEARYAEVGGHRIRYVRTGTGPSVVLVHGFGSSIYTWKDVIPGLALEHDVVALDLPGFGQSEQPADLSFRDLPSAVLGLMDHLRIERAALVGNSMGGAAAVIVAGTHPERVTALVLVDAAGFNLGGPDRPRFVGFVMSPLAGAVISALPGRHLLVRMALHEVFWDDSKVDDERVAEYLSSASRPGTFASARSLGRSLDGRSGVVAEALSRVQAPTLVIWGREDGWIPLEHADRFVGAIAGARKVVLERAGHVPQEERPEEVLRLIREHLRVAPVATR